jgi:hypothetical protein
MERRSFSINEFCARNKLSRATYYRLKGIGKGPRTFKLGIQDRITAEAETDWHRMMEADTAAPAALPQQRTGTGR